MTANNIHTITCAGVLLLEATSSAGMAGGTPEDVHESGGGERGGRRGRNRHRRFGLTISIWQSNRILLLQISNDCMQFSNKVALRAFYELID
jgi:hypothetical protein